MHQDYAGGPSAEAGFSETVRQLAHRLHLPTTFIKFLIVGGIGFLINQFCLFLLYDTPIFWWLPEKGADGSLLFFTHSDLRLFISSIIAVEIAIIAQFNFHDRWTFRNRNREGNIVLRFFKFNLSSIISPIIVVITVNVLTPVIKGNAGDNSVVEALAPYIANTVGVLLGFIWNWTLNSVIIWPTRHPAPLADSD
jgi:putative flippase GtrA